MSDEKELVVPDGCTPAKNWKGICASDCDSVYSIADVYLDFEDESEATDRDKVLMLAAPDFYDAVHFYREYTKYRDSKKPGDEIKAILSLGVFEIKAALALKKVEEKT